jgi:hypothetical protein
MKRNAQGWCYYPFLDPHKKKEKIPKVKKNIYSKENQKIIVVRRGCQGA